MPMLTPLTEWLSNELTLFITPIKRVQIDSGKILCVNLCIILQFLQFVFFCYIPIKSMCSIVYQPSSLSLTFFFGYYWCFNSFSFFSLSLQYANSKKYICKLARQKQKQIRRAHTKFHLLTRRAKVIRQKCSWPDMARVALENYG